MNAPKANTRRARPVAGSKLPDVRLTHPERVVFPESGISKLALAEHYVRVAPWMLPHVADRPLSLVRCPEGRGGPCFFQKHPPPGLSERVERFRIDENDGPAEYLVVHDVEGLVSLVQFGALELHVWQARKDRIERPDRLVFDLDPAPDVAWSEVIDAALLLREQLGQLDLESFVKTTGGKGLHIVVPIDRTQTWEQAKRFARAMADWLVRFQPDRFLAIMSKAKRTGKIFIDYLRNERGATAVAAYSTRARIGAPVSTPVSWKELPKLPSAAAFTLTNLPERLAKLRTDPWRQLRGTRQALRASMSKALETAKR